MSFQHGEMMDQPWLAGGDHILGMSSSQLTNIFQPPTRWILRESHLSSSMLPIASPRSCADAPADLAAGVDFTANASGAEIHCAGTVHS